MTDQPKTESAWLGHVITRKEALEICDGILKRAEGERLEMNTEAQWLDKDDVCVWVGDRDGWWETGCNEIFEFLIIIVQLKIRLNFVYFAGSRLWKRNRVADGE